MANHLDYPAVWQKPKAGETSPMRMVGLRDRTKQFAFRIVRMFSALPKTTLAQTIGKQALRSGTSVAANFREASRARPTAEFVSKLGIVEQELDETILWLEILVESNTVTATKLAALQKEADELLRIVVTSIQRTKQKPKAKAESGERKAD